MTRREKKRITSENEDYKEQLARALADYDNLRKRVEKEKTDISKFASMGVIVRLLPIYDMLIQAQKHLNDSGLAITIGELENLFKEEGLEKIKANKGVKFNETLHETIEVAKGVRKGTIEKELLSGWKYVDGPVIRYSKVKVTK